LLAQKHPRFGQVGSLSVGLRAQLQQLSVGEGAGDRELKGIERSGRNGSIRWHAREAVETAIDSGARLLQESRRRLPDGIREIDGVSLSVVAAAATLGFFSAWLLFGKNRYQGGCPSHEEVRQRRSYP
jgi:hypothetical protein